MAADRGSADGRHPPAYTAADFPLPKSIARAVFDKARAELACEEGDDGDLCVDFMGDGDHIDDFLMHRQMLHRLSIICAMAGTAQGPAAGERGE